MRPPGKINAGFAKDLRKYFLCAKNGHLQIKELRSTIILYKPCHASSLIITCNTDILLVPQPTAFGQYMSESPLGSWSRPGHNLAIEAIHGCQNGSEADVRLPGVGSGLSDSWQGRAGQGWEVATCDPKLPKSSSSSLVIVVTRKRISKGGKTAQRSRHSNFWTMNKICVPHRISSDASTNVSWYMSECCYVTWNQVRVSGVYQSCFLLLLLPRQPWISTASSGSQWALPDLNCKLRISVGTAEPQLRAPHVSGHSQTSTASGRSQWALPDLNRELHMSVGTAGP